MLLEETAKLNDVTVGGGGGGGGGGGSKRLKKLVAGNPIELKYVM
jgi:hypothetical protein